MKTDYVELPLVYLLNLVGSLLDHAPDDMDLSDPRYIIRLSNKGAEIGFPSDTFSLVR